jgi:hypothetical protein
MERKRVSMMIQWRKRRVLCSAVVALIAMAAATARADEINAGGITFKNIQIQKVEGDKLIYKIQSGQISEKQITDKMKVSVTDEPNLTMAEDALVAGKWSDAVDGYQKALRSAAKPWVKDYAARRLLVAGEKSERFDAVVMAYLHVLETDPKHAQDVKLTYPADPNNAYLKTAASQVDSAINSEKDQTKSISLRVFRMNIAKAMHDDETALKLGTDLQKLGGAGSAGGPALDETAMLGIIDGKLNVISALVDKKDYKGATANLEQLKATVTDPKQEAEWIWFNAEAQAGAAGDTKSPEALKGVALEYMRLVANFPNSPRVPQALLKTAGLLEKLQDTKGATAVYTQVARDYKGQSAGSEAQKNLNRLNAASGGK